VHDKLRNELFGKTASRVLANRLNINAISTLAAETPWPKRAGLTDHRVLEAHLNLANQCGQLVFTASSRQIANMIGCRRETVERSRGRLTNTGWLVVLESGKGGNASTIEILLNRLSNAPIQKRHTIYTNNNGIRCSGAFSGQLIRSADPDAFRNGALASSALEVFAHLSWTPAQPSTINELKTDTALGRSTIYSSLKVLESGGLVFRVAGGWYRLDGPPDALREKQHDLARDVFATAGLTARQREHYEQERSVYQRYWAIFNRGSREYILGEDERYAALPDEQQDYASDLARRAAEHIADLDILPFSFADLRRRAFRLVITASSPPYEDFEDLAKYIAT
jgi:hypothetical protein